MLISVDLDFFVREDPRWDFGHHESDVFVGLPVWATRYACLDLYRETDPKRWADVLPQAFFAELQRVFRFTPTTVIGWGASHRHAYEFFRGTYGRSRYVLNFDAHHDRGYGATRARVLREPVTCENWVAHLEADTKLRVTHVLPKWAASEHAHVTWDQVAHNDTAVLFDRDAEVEAVYLAQSPAWVPPHHDAALRTLLAGACQASGRAAFADVDYGIVQRPRVTRRQAQAWYRDTARVRRELIDAGVLNAGEFVVTPDYKGRKV